MDWSLTSLERLEVLEDEAGRVGWEQRPCDRCRQGWPLEREGRKGGWEEVGSAGGRRTRWEAVGWQEFRVAVGDGDSLGSATRARSGREGTRLRRRARPGGSTARVRAD